MNIVTATDSYKLGHWAQYPRGTTGVYSYFESRKGATYPETVFFGLQPILEQLEGVVVTERDVMAAHGLASVHFGRPTVFNIKGWLHIVRDHGGKLPVRIKAVPEGTVVPSGNIMMSVENTCPQCYWLTNALESLLTHVWYPSTVATLSRYVKTMMAAKLGKAGEPLDGLEFMLHDFGYRGAATHDAAEIGGAAHLVNFKGTDTVPALLLALDHYEADIDTLGFSVPASEHSVMTALGHEGEYAQLVNMLDVNPTGIVSIVGDSYNIYQFARWLTGPLKERVLARDGKVVLRPDSTTPMDPTPPLEVVHLLEILWEGFGGTTNEKGYRLLDPHIGMLWGDGLDAKMIEKIIDRMMMENWSPANMVFGMGGGLLQKVNRDTQRFAFKSSAQERDGVWHEVMKEPLDASKTSKAGRLILTHLNGEWKTEPEIMAGCTPEIDKLVTVFEDGEITQRWTFEEIRERAQIPQLREAAVA
jgi:nicotinamide phosphoribosyltransferase